MKRFWKCDVCDIMFGDKLSAKQHAKITGHTVADDKSNPKDRELIGWANIILKVNKK